MDLGSSIRRRRRLRGQASRAVGLADRSRIAILIAAAGLISGYLVATRLLFPPGAPPPSLQGVPDVADRAFESALTLLADAGLSIARVDSVHHPAVVAGMVIGQSPLPGRTALPGAGVRITLSLGPEIGAVPDVTRLLGGRAARVLEASGFSVEVDTVESEAAAGRVLQIDPAPGTELALPGAVRLEVSLGPPTLPLPDLSGMWIEEAIATLDTLGLVVSGFDIRYSILNVDRVFAQHPVPDTQVEAGTAVRLTVGQAMVRQP